MSDTNKPMTTELVTTQRPKSVLLDMADRYGMEPTPFEATVRAICMPANSSREEFAAFLLVAKEYKLNPLTKEIYAFPKRGGGIIPIVSIDGWVSLVNSHPACDGFTFSWVQDDKGEPISCTCIMYRKDRSHPTEVTEYLSECIRPTDPWKMKHRMLRHKAMIQGARYAFGFSGIYDEDEGAKIAEARDITPERPTPPAPPPEDEPPVSQNVASNDAPKGDKTPTEDLNDDASEFVDVNKTPGSPEELDAYLTRVDEELAALSTETEVVAHYEALGVDDALLSLGEAVQDRAAAIRNKHLDRVTTGDMFPGDKPLPKAVKIAGTP